MGNLLRGAWAVVRRFLPDARDLHLYGGAVLVALGVSTLHRGLALCVLGIYLIYLGRPWR